MDASLETFQQQIMQLESSWFWFLIAAIGFISFFSWLKGFRALHKARIIENVPTSLIRSAVQGYVELIGDSAAMDGPPIIAPLSKKECLWFRYRIEEHRRSNKRSYWHVIEKATSDALFLLRDDTGHCVIDPDHAEVTGAEFNSWRGSSRWPASFTGMTRSNWFLGGRYRYSEWRLHAHQPLYAIGQFRTVGGGTDFSPIREEVRELIRKWKHDPETLAKFDSDGDGHFDQQEWENLREAAHQQVLKSRVEQSAAPAVHTMKKPEDGRPYLLSTENPEKLSGKYRWQSRFLVISAVLASAMTLFMINIRVIG